MIPEKDWEVDIEHLKPLVDSKTSAFMIIHPSNPCGNVFSKEHQLELIKFAHEHRLPILADEVYYGIVYEKGKEFHSFANLT